MKLVGLEDRQTAFLYSDTQIVQESMVEQICGILNNGEVPNLFPPEEMMKIIDEIGSAGFNGTNNEKYAEFSKRCRKNLHMVICMSPVDEKFRPRLRTFPALVNCTTIDWFLPWPEEALKSTAESYFVGQMKITDKEQRDSMIEISVDMQMRII